jgi:methionyl-tRNA formyltransferase
MKAVVVGAVKSTEVAVRTIAGAPDWEVAAVITLPRSLAARHSDYVDLRSVAAEVGAEAIEAANANAPDIVARIKALAPACVFVIGWSQICGAAFRAAAGDAVVGYHPGPLPQMRGRAVIPWTILLDCSITASTLFWIDGGVDSGPILAQKFLHVARDETATTLYRRHLDALEEILGRSLPEIAAGSAPRIPQDERYATWTARRTPEDGEIDWTRPAHEIERLIRATTRPYPGAWTSWKGERLVIWRALLWPEGDRHAGVPGQAVLRDGRRLAIRCGAGWLLAEDWELSDGGDMQNHGVLGRKRAGAGGG